MATCGGLQPLFENPTFHESWKHIESMKASGDSDSHHSFTEIFGQLYLKENLHQDPSPEISSPLFTLSPSSSLSSELSHDVHPSSDEEESQAARRRSRRRRSYGGGFPPPITCMGKSCLQPIRRNGRFILTEMRISTQEFLHACRENGRLKVHVVHEDTDEDEEEAELQACRRNGRLKVSIVESDDEEEDGKR